MKKFISSLVLALFAMLPAMSQLPSPALLGYWHNWNDGSAPYFAPDQADSRYNVIALAFAIPRSGTDYDMTFVPTQVSEATLKSQIQNMQAQGRKVLISVGGANHPIALSNATERDVFVQSMNAILSNYGFDGLDLDVEGGSLSVTAGTTIANPTDAPVVNMIAALQSIMQNYQATKGRKMILTMAPETAYVQGGQSAYGGVWGAYLPVIHALRESIDLLHVQLYNSGSMYGIDRVIYYQATPDFIVAMTEAVIKGFNTNGGFFTGLPAEKVAVGLPACASAAGGGYVSPANVQAAVNYLRGTGPKPGSYTLQQVGGYPTLRGMMTWSINWDRVSTCGTAYEYAQNFQTIFGGGGGTSCPTPATPAFTSIQTNSAVASWPAVSGATAYLYRYKAATATTYTAVNVANTSYTMTGLAAGTAYVADVQAICSSGSSTVSASGSFTTQSVVTNCNPPVSLSISKISANAATASWPAVTGATGYEFQYHIKGSLAAWTNKVVTGTSFAMSGLKAGTLYETRVRTRCSSTVFSGFSGIVEFTTLKKGTKASVTLSTETPEFTLNLSPNPARHTLRLHSTLAAGEVKDYVIVNAQGVLMQGGRIASPVVMVDVSGYGQGMYFVRVGGIVKKFVVIR